MQGPYPNGGAEPGGGLRLGQLRKEKQKGFHLGGLLFTSELDSGSEKETPVSTETALGRRQGLLELLLLLRAEGLCPQEVKLVPRGRHHHSNRFQLQGGHTRGEQRRTGTLCPSRKRGKVMEGTHFRQH